MTYRENLKMICPQATDPMYLGACFGCPSDWGMELEQVGNCMKCRGGCRNCWDREMPEDRT